MGIEIDREHFEDAEYTKFGARLREDLQALRELLARPGFGEGPASIGAELELNLVDAEARPLTLNRAVLADTHDPRITLEIARFNLEINTLPVLLAGQPFSALEAQLRESLTETANAAARHGGRVATIGILPTLEPSDLLPDALTDGCRYRALSAGIRRIRGGAFPIRIEGRDVLSLDADDVTLEGANTSFQVHLRVSPAQFARTYNAAQMATAVALAIGANSPTFLGHHLWDETRVALFRQSIDDRIEASENDWRPARVSFGHGWARLGAEELFAESVAMHAPLLPLLSDEDPLACVRAGRIPRLSELRLHNGTVWRWNRPVYDDAGGGHLRIEMRALPAGPSVVDSIATAAFLLGLTLGLAPRADTLVHELTFGQARRNFYEAARFGLGAELLWPVSEGLSPQPLKAVALVPQLLPIARRGLLERGVEADEIDRLFEIISARVAAKMTGAEWQRRTLARTGCPSMLEQYLAHSASGQPVHLWPRGS